MSPRPWSTGVVVVARSNLLKSWRRRAGPTTVAHHRDEDSPPQGCARLRLGDTLDRPGQGAGPDPAALESPVDTITARPARAHRVPARAGSGLLPALGGGRQ